MSEESPLEELKKKYPTLTEEQLVDIMQTGAEKGLIQLKPTEETPSLEGMPPGTAILKALKGEADLDQIMRFMIIDNWVKERFGKGKEVPPEIQELLERVKTGKGDIDALMDKMMKYELIQSFMEGRRGRSQTGLGDADKIASKLDELKTSFSAALTTHKLEDEKARSDQMAELHKKRADEAEKKLEEHIKTEEEEKKLEAKVKAEITPIQEQIDKRIDTIAELLKGVPLEKRKGLVFDLGEMITEEVGEEIRNRVVDGLKSAFGEKEGLPVTTTPEGKIQVDWYKLGERALKTLDRFIEKLPTQAPPKREVKEKELPKLPEAPPSKGVETPPPAKPTAEAQPTTPPPPPSEATKPAEPTTTPETLPPPPQPETKLETKPEPEKPIIVEMPKEETTETEKTTSEQEPATKPETSAEITPTPSRRKKTSKSN